MNIAAKGSPKQLEELSSVLSLTGREFTVLENTKNISSASFDIIFDLNFDDQPDSISDYSDINPKTVLVLGAVKIQLHQAIPRKLQQQVIGINALPTFLNRKVLEASTLKSETNPDVLTGLGWEKINYSESRIGMVTPRIISMIINEAYFTLQEGTASREDIDKGMKLGTAYPYGPFEWCDKIGIVHVYEVLDAMASDTHDERYKICNLLKTEYLIAKN
jgi:3-hydroxybutyryl-CoA dehydrogenase